METFGTRLRAAALAAGIATPEQLAKACGASAQTVRKWLAMGEPRLSAMYLFRLSNALDVRMRWLMTGEGALPLPQHFDAVMEILGRLSPDRAGRWLAIGRDMIDER